MTSPIYWVVDTPVPLATDHFQEMVSSHVETIFRSKSLILEEILRRYVATGTELKEMEIHSCPSEMWDEIHVQGKCVHRIWWERTPTGFQLKVKGEENG